MQSDRDLTIHTNSEFLTIPEHARELRRKPQTVYNRISQGTWPVKTVLIGGRRLVPRVEHDRYIRQVLIDAGVALLACGTEPSDPLARDHHNASSKHAKKKRGRPRNSTFQFPIKGGHDVS